MRALVLAGMLAAACFLTLMPGPAASNDEDDLVEGDDYELDEAVVKLKTVDPDSGDPVRVQDIVDDYGVRVEEQLPGGLRVYLLRLGEDANEEDEVAEFVADPRIEYAEVNYAAEPPGGNARFRAREESRRVQKSTNDYAEASLGLACVRDSGATGAGSTVAVLDTGAQLRHPALRENFAGMPVYDFVEDKEEFDPSTLKGPMAGHGTHVAGIVDLVAPEAKIMPLRVLNSQGRGNAVAIAKAVAFARTNSADVINLSLSTPDRSLLVDDYLDWARASGIVVAAAAGNDGMAAMHYPAADSTGTDGLLSVTAVNRMHMKSSYANYGTWVDVAAPGNAIRSAYPVGEYANLSGTSMSTPFVAGEAAVLYAQSPERTPSEIEALIKGGANPLDDLNPDHAGLLGAGEVDVSASLQRLNPDTGCP